MSYYYGDPRIRAGGTATPAPGGGRAGTIGPPAYGPPSPAPGYPGPGGGTGGSPTYPPPPNPNDPGKGAGPPVGYPPGPPSTYPEPPKGPPGAPPGGGTKRPPARPPKDAPYDQNTQTVRPDDATAKAGTTGKKAAGPPVEENPKGFYQDPTTGPGGPDGLPPTGPLPNAPPAGPNPRGGGTTGGTQNPWGPGGTGTEGSGLGEEWEAPQGGLFRYYSDKMDSRGMSEAERNALEASTMTPIQQQAQQAKDAMMRVRAATGNDAGLYGGLVETARTAADQMSQAGRQNSLQNEQIRRAEQAEGAAGGLNLYGQTQAETMEYLRMLGNLFGRERGTSTWGDTSGFNVEGTYEL